MINFSVKGYNLKPFSLSTKYEMDHYLSFIHTEISDYTFASNFIWLSHASGFYGIINNCFSLFILQSDQLTMLLPPMGEKRFINDAIVQCFEIMNSVNKDYTASRIDYVCESLLSDFVNYLEEGTEIFEILENYVVEKRLVDYVYNTQDLINLSGGVYHTKRNEINKFNKVYQNVEVAIIDPKVHRDVCMDIFHQWTIARMRYMPKENKELFMDGINYERFALKRIFANYNELELFGIILKINDQFSGFTIGEKLNESTASIIVEKTDFEILGSAQYIFREFCKALQKEYGSQYINVGDDMGLENLKKVKMSYRPLKLIPKYTIYQKIRS